MAFRRKDLLGLRTDERGDRADPRYGGAVQADLHQRHTQAPYASWKDHGEPFYEPSTSYSDILRTGWEMDERGRDQHHRASSSVAKGESLKDTVRTLESLGANIIVMRHRAAGAPHFLARSVDAAVVNAGDGAHEHPTQALLDLYTIREKKGRIAGLKVLIVGDILHSRVAKSNIWGLIKMGASVTVVGPPTLIPPEIEKTGAKVSHNLDEAIRDVDVINVLRIQLERQKKGLFPSTREYVNLYGLNRRRLAKAREDVLVLHPGPANLGIEITQEVATCDRSAIAEQVTNGVAVRMALLYLISGGGKQHEAAG